ncbi:MAG: hypothetical protein KKD26_01940 [Alphaproteobacteria bacterium]|jgi:hypothetical protein|uniref:hypothetical protein n=1 Tax=Brevundimonas TaxID=41275 RepID=UPI0012B6A4FB|nr:MULTISPECIES: hypothetical protein [Brevundimonas]MBU4195364.1 hypothetical protein [Alphaproteobacteria bacterium]MBU4237998.1 hypothetical protein [Alphaproteobacteria bacterium]MCG2665167.1 hypothetical protein [Brevundimonas sp.]
MKISNIVGLILACAILAFGFWLIWMVTQALFRDMSAQQSVALIAVIATTVTALVTFVRTKEKEAEARLFPEKAKIYAEILDVLNELMSKSKPWGKDSDPDEIAKRLNDARYKLVVWGSAKAVKSFEAIETVDANGNVGDMLARLAYLYGWIRRDLGHKDTAYDLAHIAAHHIIASERSESYAQLISSPTFKSKVLPTFKGQDQ